MKTSEMSWKEICVTLCACLLTVPALMANFFGLQTGDASGMAETFMDESINVASAISDDAEAVGGALDNVFFQMRQASAANLIRRKYKRRHKKKSQAAIDVQRLVRGRSARKSVGDIARDRWHRSQGVVRATVRIQAAFRSKKEHLPQEDPPQEDAARPGFRWLEDRIRREMQVGAVSIVEPGETVSNPLHPDRQRFSYDERLERAKRGKSEEDDRFGRV